MKRRRLGASGSDRFSTRARDERGRFRLCGSQGHRLVSFLLRPEAACRSRAASSKPACQSARSGGGRPFHCVHQKPEAVNGAECM